MKAYEDGRKAGIIETENIINNGRKIATNLDSALKINEKLREELRRLAKLVDQTQKDAYDLGYLNGTKHTEE